MKDLIEKYKKELAKLKAELKNMDMCDNELRLSGKIRAYGNFIKDLDVFYKLPKRRPFLFTINKRHNGEQVVITELFYLEPNEKPADFLQRAYKYIRNLHGEGCIISKQEIKL